MKESVAEQFEVNGRGYAWPRRPVVVVCIDGSEDAYHERAIADGRMPFLERMLERGSDLRADCTMPSFTNPNNISIATGAPPAVHGICGNYFYDTTSGTEIMMNAPELLRVPTLFAAFSQAGAKVAVITAKDKLRRLLGRDLTDGICFSAEKADQVTDESHGISKVLERVGMELPSVYSAELSELVMAAGTDILAKDRPDLMYLSLTDYIQHKHAPGSPVANDFYAMLDSYFEQIDALGAVLVITADHGMNAKSDADGTAQVVFLQDLLDSRLGAGAARVILPITDPYTVHHGALGSYATVHLPDGTDRAGLLAELAALEGVDTVLTREEACERFELPGDRIGDLVVIATRNTALGTTPARHDISGFKEPLRSHGGLTEQRVPFLVNAPTGPLPDGHRLRNFDAYWVGNALAAGRPLTS
ncbi:phosphonoacetate hydrolase [Streptomyces sp. NBC_00841]|uniref:phosphonoacetate hydrolase n=1 Tax=unclassified Streptomyces TaxID=2593676 RepID=UPI002250A48C|nr:MULTISPECIES: phosphonoacetate hydrolase [unclassified Streptomyces]MCX4531566.1 phosphonoacetate hydrolase [Streptomyces sp. NBC_01669]WSA02863.1 phosphonoacetate hydrolase [Streptomyces sp. NBC_00841]